MGKVFYMRKGERHKKPAPRLPAGYTELAYIESSGTQHIDTGFYPTGKSRVVMDIYQNGATSSGCVFGCRNSSSNTATGAYSAWITSATGARSDFYGTSLTITGTFNVRMTIDKNGNTCTINGATVTNTAADNAKSTFQLYLFAVNQIGNANNRVKAKLYSCQIYEAGEIVRDFVPCISDTGEVGLFDRVRWRFYGNAGTGVFTGSEVA